MTEGMQRAESRRDLLRLAREYAPVALALLSGLALSIGLQVMMRDQVRNVARYDFSEEAKSCIGALEREIDANIDLVRWLGATFQATPYLNRYQFHALAEALQAESPPSVSLLWAPQLADVYRPTFEAVERRGGQPAYSIHEFDINGASTPAKPRPVYFPVQFTHELEGIGGFDLGSDPVLLRYLNLAEEKRTMFFVSEAPCVNRLAGQRAVLAICPVFSDEASTGLYGAPGPLIGFAAGLIRLDIMTESALASLVKPEVDIHIFDFFGKSGEQFLHFRPGASQPRNEPYVDESNVQLLPALNYVGAVSLGTTRRWLVACTPAPDYAFGIRSWSPLLGLAMGLAFTFVVAYHFYANIRQRRLAEETVVRRMAQLKRTNARLVHEVAERERFEQERDGLLALLEASNASLQQVNTRLERSNGDLQDFALVASHDLKEPLRKVRVLAQSLRDKWGERLDPGAGEYLDLMEGALQRMHNLITNLLRVSRVSTHGQPFERVDLGNLINEVLSDLAVRIEETGGQIDVGTFPEIEADPMQMRQFFQNILDNSLKYHRDGVPPRIKVEAREHPENGAAGTCTIVFEDNGTGFAPELTERAFTLFQRLDNGARVEGSGVGLAVCRKIAERHGGAIAVRSEAGRGSTFTITLPLTHNGH